MPHHSISHQVATAITRLCAQVSHDQDAGVGEKPRGLVVALSGGPDSVALLLIAHEWAQTSGAPLVAAHLNHRLRGDEADADEAFCRALCARLGLTLHTQRRDPRPLARQRRCGLEEAGRVLRRRFFTELLAADPRLLCVATGHHRDDQSETVVMRLFRGTGLDGLRGIRPVQGRTIHPLLEFRRTEIVRYLEQRGQPFRCDATNEAGDQTRNRIRRELLPLVRSIFGRGSDAAPARLAALIETDAQWLDAAAREQLTALTDDDALAVGGLVALPPALAQRVVRLFYARAFAAENVAAPDLTDSDTTACDLQRNHVVDLLAWLATGSSGQSRDLPHGLRAVREFDRLRIEPGEKRPEAVSTAASYRILVEPAAPDHAGELDGRAGGGRPWHLTCPAAALQGTLRLRNWLAGDRIAVAGLGGHKKVSDLLRERRVPVAARSAVLVVEDQEGLLWVVGHARAARAELLPEAGPAVTIAVVPRTATSGTSA